MAEVGGRPGIKGSCGKRRMRLKYCARDVQNSSEIFFSFWGGVILLLKLVSFTKNQVMNKN